MRFLSPPFFKKREENNKMISSSLFKSPQLPNLSNYRDISEFMAAEMSDSEADDPSLAHVDVSGRGGYM